MSRITPFKRIVFVLAASFLLLAGAGWYTGCLAAHNDFWGAVFIAQQMDPAVPESFHNGFFPLGYPLLLKAMSGAVSLDILGFAASFAAALVVLAASWRLAARFMPASRAHLVPPFVALHPLCFFYFTTAGVDPVVMALFLTGLVLLLRALESPGARAWKTAAAAGLLLGLSGLGRYHALVAALILAIAVALAYRRIALPLVAVAFIALAYSPQALVNLSLGLSPLHTNYELAVYDLMHEVNWHALGDIEVQPTMLQVLLSDPGLFLRQYARGVASLMIYALPALVLAVAAGDAPRRRGAAAAALFLAGYALVFGLSVGGRAPLLVLPVALACLGGVASVACDRWRARASSRSAPALATAAALVAVAAVFAAKDARVLRARAGTAATYRVVEALLADEGVRDAREVFTTDFDLYFRAIPPYRPRYNGGWGLFGTYRWREEFPQVPTDDLENFIAALRAHGRRFLILSPGAGNAAPFLADLHASFTPRDGLVPVRRAGRLSIFAVTETP